MILEEYTQQVINSTAVPFLCAFLSSLYPHTAGPLRPVRAMGTRKLYSALHLEVLVRGIFF